VALDACITLSGSEPMNAGFTLHAKANRLNKHGAAIQLNRELKVGSTVVIRNIRQTQAPARVVNCVAELQGVYIYGVEFLEPDAVNRNFWGINFPAPMSLDEGVWFLFKCSCGQTGWFVMPNHISFGGLLSPELTGYCPKLHRTTIRGTDIGNIWRSKDQKTPPWYPAVGN